jgi:hypothetical protein
MMQIQNVNTGGRKKITCRVISVKLRLGREYNTSNDADILDELMLKESEASLLVDRAQVGIHAAVLHLNLHKI